MVLNATRPYRVHDLVLFSCRGYENEWPVWADRASARSWAVVRRGTPSRDGMVAAGLRGRTRAERAAIELRAADVVRRVSPEDLVPPLPPHPSALPARGIRESLRLLAATSSRWFGGRVWGPAGSVGFQLATGLPVVRETSDLDIIVRTPEYLPPRDARSILNRLAELPCPVDCLLETRAGAIALSEWAASSSGSDVLLRTAHGARLTKDPWRPSREMDRRPPA